MSEKSPHSTYAGYGFASQIEPTNYFSIFLGFLFLIRNQLAMVCMVRKNHSTVCSNVHHTSDGREP
jgi:hypothetical protein